MITTLLKMRRISELINIYIKMSHCNDKFKSVNTFLDQWNAVVETVCLSA